MRRLCAGCLMLTACGRIGCDAIVGPAGDGDGGAASADGAATAGGPVVAGGTFFRSHDVAADGRFAA